MENLKVISVLVKNRFGVLTRVSNVFSRRGINIKQLTVAETTSKDISRITILTADFDVDTKQLDKQLKKIEDVQDAVILPYNEVLGKELLLVKIKYEKDSLESIQEKLSESSGKIISFDEHVLIGQIVGTSKKIEGFIESIKNYEIIEMSRSGITALNKSFNTFNI